MAGDHKFYYDISSEIQLSDWTVIEEDNGRVRLTTTVESLSGEYVFLAPCDSETFPTLVSLTVNGMTSTVRKRDAVYIHDDYARFGVDIVLFEGRNEIAAELTLGEGVSVGDIPFRLVKSEGAPTSKTAKVRHWGYPVCNYCTDSGLSFDGFSEGIGRKKSPGRFGFSKGDGLLDCAMPSLGVVDKMFLCGQPKYKKPYRWSYSLLPEGMPLHGSFEPRDVGIEDDEIDVNHLSVRWSASFEGKKFTSTYSLASPAILTEREDGKMLLSGLRYAGNYSSVLIPKREGVVEYPLDGADISNMAENWILLFNSTEFPDVPLMLVFDRNPTDLTVKRDGAGRLLSVAFGGVPLMFSLTPFGIERFDPGKMPIEDAIRRAEFWSHAVLAYPVGHREYFRRE